MDSCTAKGFARTRPGNGEVPCAAAAWHCLSGSARADFTILDLGIWTCEPDCGSCGRWTNWSALHAAEFIERCSSVALLFKDAKGSLSQAICIRDLRSRRCCPACGRFSKSVPGGISLAAWLELREFDASGK